MKNVTRCMAVSILFALVISPGYAGDAASHFARMKSLAGTWKGTGPEGKSVTVTYEVVANGSVVMERMQTEGEPAMITMYHLDGDDLMMTHYCSAMNQPRMKAKATEADNTVAFELIDITNLAKPTDGHMQKMRLTFQDEEHITTHWTFKKGDQEHSTPFELQRVKMSDK